MFVSTYGQVNEKSDEEEELLWGKLNECLGSFRENVKVVVLGDFNARVGNESVMDVIGKHRVPGRNDSGNELIGFCIERGFLLEINKYTWERLGR